jgi:hypothetical protein
VAGFVIFMHDREVAFSLTTAKQRRRWPAILVAAFLVGVAAFIGQQQILALLGGVR